MRDSCCLLLSNMASKEKRKSDKKAAKKLDENMNKSIGSRHMQELDAEEATVQSDSVIVEEVPALKVLTPEPIYKEPILAKLIVTCFKGERVKGLYEGEGEAHFIDGHTYKGMFSEGFMHGRGVYVWFDGTIYEGDFLKNKITGKGQYTWPDGSTYVGDVSNGKRNGFGTFQSADNTKSYTGDWYFGCRRGKGRMDYDAEGKSYYEGDWANGIKHGWGTRLYPSGNMYHGMWFNNVRHGEGTMRWLDRDQVYCGQWENGIQHGMGQHIWLFRRVHKSQYPLRNMYSGQLVNGKRHGEGVFFYANGAKYEGYWKDNMKHGKGKFTFKNGRIYEGMFENDHIMEYPDFTIDGTISPDLSKIRTRTPICSDNVSIHSNESRNTVSPSFQLDINTLLASLPSEDNEHEVNQVMYAVTRHVSTLHRIYTFYSTLGYQESPDNTFIMSKMQFWIFLKDIRIHCGKNMLTDIDRVIGTNYQKSNFEIHNPYEKILHRQFVNYLIVIAHMLYSKDHSKTNETGPVLDYCFSRLMRDNVLCHGCKVKSPIFAENKRAINALVHMDQAYEVYQTVSTPRKQLPKEPVLKMRQFLLLLKDFNLINQDLTPKAVIAVLASDNSTVSDGKGFYNLELEMTFLEFFEALVLCAEKFVTEKVVADPTTPRLSVILGWESSVTSAFAYLTVNQSVEEEEPSQIITEPQSQVNLQTEKITPSPALSQKSAAGIIKTSETETNITKVISAGKLSSLAGKSKESGIDQAEEQKRYSVMMSLSPKPTIDSQALNGSSHSLPVLENEVIEAEELVQSEVIIKENDLVLVDEATRKFNFWTHQIHLFFVRKFFPSAEKYIQIKKLMENIRLEDAKKRLICPETEAVVITSETESARDSKVDIAEEEEEDTGEYVEQ